jgi:hypothetical protein
MKSYLERLQSQVYSSPLEKGYHLEPDTSELLDQKVIALFNH